MPRAEEPLRPPEWDVRHRLLASAAQLFAQKGYASTSVREIVAAVGVTKPVLYYYFGSKEGLYIELMKSFHARLHHFLEVSRQDSQPVRQRILKLIDGLFTMFLQDIDIARMIVRIMHFGPTQGEPFFDFGVFKTKVREIVHELVAEGIRKGELRQGDSQDMTWAVLGALNIAIEIQLYEPESRLGREGLARILSLIFEGISANA